MSDLIDLSVVKDRLRIIHDADDELLQRLLDGAEDEAARFLGVDDVSDLVIDSNGTLPPSLVEGVMLLVAASYEAPAQDIEVLRAAALHKLQPFRTGMGV